MYVFRDCSKGLHIYCVPDFRYSFISSGAREQRYIRAREMWGRSASLITSDWSLIRFRLLVREGLFPFSWLALLLFCALGSLCDSLRWLDCQAASPPLPESISFFPRIASWLKSAIINFFSLCIASFFFVALSDVDDVSYCSALLWFSLSFCRHATPWHLLRWRARRGSIGKVHKENQLINDTQCKRNQSSAHAYKYGRKRV